MLGVSVLSPFLLPGFWADSMCKPHAAICLCFLHAQDQHYRKARKGALVCHIIGDREFDELVGIA